MLQIAIVSLVLCGSIFLGAWMWRRRVRRELERNSIDADALHSLIESGRRVHLFDVRQPLDVLAYPEIIPGAVRIAPKELIADPSLIPRDEDSVIYCTCPGEETSREIVTRARALKFMRMKLLKGGLETWKAKGYPVVPYRESFHLDTAQ